MILQVFVSFLWTLREILVLQSRAAGVMQTQVVAGMMKTGQRKIVKLWVD